MGRQSKPHFFSSLVSDIRPRRQVRKSHLPRRMKKAKTQVVLSLTTVLFSDPFKKPLGKKRIVNDPSSHLMTVADGALSDGHVLTTVAVFPESHDLPLRRPDKRRGSWICLTMLIHLTTTLKMIPVVVVSLRTTCRSFGSRTFHVVGNSSPPTFSPPRPI